MTLRDNDLIEKVNQDHADKLAEERAKKLNLEVILATSKEAN
ncbi:hypothetical protein [Sulfitobacter sp. R18_1]|nr:hypothetical protein [Sulfitobacter sp. R18_1]